MSTVATTRVAFQSPSRLPEPARHRIAEALAAVLVDGLDLHGQIKVAHWNVKGAHFAALHPLFETFAIGLAAQTDAVAERAVTLGAKVHGTARHVARTSRLSDYDEEATDGLVHAALLAERFETFLDGVRAARRIADEEGDLDTSDLLTGIVGEFEKHGWFLRATLAG